jgi:predicted ester cyclase
MSSEENKQFYVKFIELNTEVNLDNVDQFIDTYFTPDYKLHNYDPQGKELDFLAFTKVAHQWVKDYEDLHYEVDDALAEGDRVAIRGHGSARTKTGERTYWNFFAIARIVGKKVAEEWQMMVEVPVEMTATP